MQESQFVCDNGNTGFSTGPLNGTLPDIGALIGNGQTLYASDVDDNVVLNIGPVP